MSDARVAIGEIMTPSPFPTSSKGNRGPALNIEMLKSLRIVDEQDHIQAGNWFNLPKGNPQTLVERMVYYRYTLMMFYFNEEFYILPYVGRGGLDVRGRWKYAKPLPFNGSSTVENYETGKSKAFIDKEYRILYDIVDPEELTEATLEDCCVILNDYSPQISTWAQPRANLSEPLLQVMSECVPFMRTSLINSTGVAGYKVKDENDAAECRRASRAATDAAIYGERWMPIVGDVTTEQLQTSATANSEEFLLTMQALDNLRLSLHGLKNGGLFQKKSHMLEAEESMNNGTAALVMKNKVAERQLFCNIANSLWGLGMWYEPDESQQTMLSMSNNQMQNEMEEENNE